MNFKISLALSLLYLLSCSPKRTVTVDYSYEEDNIAILKDQMTDSLYLAMEGREVKKSERVVKTEKEAIKLAKPVLLKVLGDNYNVEDRIYTVHLLNGYWIVRGHLPDGFSGGTLVSVIDSESGDSNYTFVWR